MAAPFSEFAGNKRLLWIAREWDEHADELAVWAMDKLVNRRDVWSQYTLRGDKISVVMLPVKERRAQGTDMVTLHKLHRHFAGRARSHLIGLHSISDHNTCKWFAIDVDLHDPNAANADEMAAANLAACLAWAEKLRAKFFDPCLMDSSGKGGYHLWTLLDREYPLADVYNFVSDIRNDYEKYGLPRKPEVFPPKIHVEPGHLPYGLRLPGRHHTNHHYTRVWNFDSVGDNDWLEGSDAIEALLSLRPAALPRTAVKQKKENVRTVAPKKPEVKRKPRVCVDLDGVLAKYEGWSGAENIGPPLPGALEFAWELAEIADIIIFTSRCSQDKSNASDRRDDSLSPGQIRIQIIDWLEKNKFPYTDVYVGKGKPRVAAFIDDRAVYCSPQKDKQAFGSALEATRKLIKARPAKKAVAAPAKKKR